MNKLRNQNGDADMFIIIIYALIIIGVIGFLLFKGIYSRTAGNKTPLDLQYKYTKAITSINGERLEIDIDTWSDYEGEQLQIISKDGKVYLVSSFNTILIKE